MVDAAVDGYHAGFADFTHQPHGLAGNGQAALRLRTDRNVLNVASQGLHQPVVIFVPAVVAHLVAQQAGRDAQLRDTIHSNSFLWQDRELIPHPLAGFDLWQALFWAGDKSPLVSLLYQIWRVS